MPFNDDTLMPFGQYRDTPLKKVPAPYLLTLYDERKAPPLLRAYIKSSLDVLRMEEKRLASGRLASCLPRGRR